MRQFSKLTDLNLRAEGSSKVAMDGFEPCDPQMAGRHASTRPQARVILSTIPLKITDIHKIHILLWTNVLLERFIKGSFNK